MHWLSLTTYFVKYSLKHYITDTNQHPFQSDEIIETTVQVQNEIATEICHYMTIRLILNLVHKDV